ncbi:MAG: saccharopine dehydrogenase NADP-binding domain-containing protein [Hahellaceae bacterium]|nr:saccharopine dehydrogenase NADP-binding domain-containing protein [Hahellaceae bacterium]MCP5212741.1 saccharopine dehydrogenase NADP-binding domain-containing protein [Hahellaceae bacterium]
MDNKNIVILGGYGNFGKRIAEGLLDLANVTIIICGRSKEKADLLCRQWRNNNPTVSLMPAALDINSPQFEADLSSLNPYIVVHTGGPFQGQDYSVPKACINVGAHYIDLADDRRFVCDIAVLDEAARNKSVLVVSGASSVPGLSSCVVDHYMPKFYALTTIDFAISPGNKAERGEATIRAILSYTGKTFKVLRNKKWIDVVGWGESRKRDFGGSIGSRWLANIDIPDLELFPLRYPTLENVQFQAGLEVAVLHHGMRVMSKLTQLKIVPSWAPMTKLIVKASELFLPFGTDNGAMQVTLRGVGHNDEPLQIDWTLYANDGVGPYIPTISAIILARKLFNGTLNRVGATACQGMYSLEEFDHYAKRWGIFHTEKSRQSKSAR